jgi:hypothetical protein
MKLKKIIPMIIPALATAVIFYFCKRCCIAVNLNKFLELSITVFSILLGFLFTITTIIHSVKNEKMEFIKKSGGMDDLNIILKTSIYFSFVVVFLTMLYFLIEEFFSKFEVIKYILLFVHIAAASYCFKFIRVFFKIILK